MKKVEKFKQTIDKERTVAQFCDFCGRDYYLEKSDDVEKEMKDVYGFDASGNTPDYATEVQIRLSNSYPEMGASKTISLDVCATCFKKEIIDRARQAHTEENDW